MNPQLTTNLDGLGKLLTDHRDAATAFLTACEHQRRNPTAQNRQEVARSRKKLRAAAHQLTTQTLSVTHLIEWASGL